MSVFHLMLTPFSTSHVVGMWAPSAIPALPAPRNDGQLPTYADAVEAAGLDAAPGRGVAAAVFTPSTGATSPVRAKTSDRPLSVTVTDAGGKSPRFAVTIILTGLARSFAS